MSDAIETVPVIDETQLNAFGVQLFNMFTTHVTDRKAAEDRWLQNMRQFRGIYDPEIKISADCSKAYPKLTRKVVIGTVARLMQMLFPQTEKNYGVTCSPLPDLTKEQLQEVLDTISALAAQGGDATQVQLKDEDIEKAIYEYAKHKAEQMETKVDDDMKEMEYITLARRVVFSAVLYNLGVLTGPYNVKVRARTWQKNDTTGKYEAIEVEKYKPVYEFLSLWDHYPDMTAKTLDKQDGAFDRHIMTRAQVEELRDRPDFMKDRIDKWLIDNPAGNYKAQWWETIIRGEPKSDRTYAQKEGRKYELLSYWGNVTGKDIRAAGVAIADDEVGKTFHANVWQFGNTVIKAKLAPFDGKVKHHHYFIFEEDDLSLLGIGQSDTMRDSQLSLCEVTRAMLDNASVVGSMVEVNDDLLAPGQDTTIRKNKTFHREGEGASAGYPAVRDIKIDSHLQDMLALRAAILDFSNQESGLPPPSMGDVSQGGSEALRTQGNASMFLGAAALPVRDTVRNFDSFTMSVVGSLVQWNMKFDPNPSRDGDLNVIARGSTSLIAKEVRAQALAMLKQTLTPEDWPYFKRRQFLIDTVKAHDLMSEDLMEDEDKANDIIAQNQQTQAQAAQQQGALVEAKVHQALANAVAFIAAAKKDDASIGQDAAALLLEALNVGHQNAIKQHIATKPEPKGTGAK